MFEVGVFTDCESDESLNGRSGFNFQAASPGFDAQLQEIGREQLVHPTATLDGADSFTYRWIDSTLFFSKGRDLGATASGRGGNQITEMVACPDAEELQPYVPAQFFSATSWDLSKRPSKQAIPWTDIEVDPAFEVDELIGWVRSDAARWAFFPQLLSVFEDRLSGRNMSRIVLAHDDIYEAMRWMSLATLLVNRPAMLTLSIQGPLDDPTAGVAAVVCVPLRCLSGDPSGTVVCNLESLEVERPGEGFQRISVGIAATLRLLQECDTFDAVEIITLARRWDPVVEPALAFAGAEMVCASTVADPHWENSVIDLVTGLARGGLGADLQTYAEEFTRLISLHGATSDGDPCLLAQAALDAYGSGGSLELASLLLDASASAAATHPQQIGVWAQLGLSSDLGLWRLSSGREARADALMRVIEAAAPADIPVLLRLVDWTGLSVDTQRSAIVIRDWAMNLRGAPGAIRTTGGLAWGSAVREQIRAQLILELQAAVVSQDAAAVHSRAFVELQRGDWRELAHFSVPADGAYAPEFVRWQRLADFTVVKADKRATLVGTVDAHPAEWMMALADAAPPHVPSLWVAWIERHGAASALLRYVESELQTELSQPPRARELKQWVDFLELLGRGDRTNDQFWRTLAVRASEHLDSRQSVGQRLSKRLAFGRGASESGPNREEGA